MSQVKLIGAWDSPFTYRVIWGLKLKGLPFEYIEEDLQNKSPLLLQYNPVYRKVPVLVHGGKPLCESMIILEYIEETWVHNPLLPTYSYERAIACFLIKFEEKLGSAAWKVFATGGDEQGKAQKERLEILKTVEEMGLTGQKIFFGGEQLSLVDLAFGWTAHWLGVMEEVSGLRLLGADKFPRLHSWIQNFKQVPVIKENLPDRDRMLVHFKRIREILLASG